MENEKDKSKKEFRERRGGEDRRKFSYGYKGPERRSGKDRREQNN